jgi:hypothetical protein
MDLKHTSVHDIKRKKSLSNYAFMIPCVTMINRLIHTYAFHDFSYKLHWNLCIFCNFFCLEPFVIFVQLGKKIHNEVECQQNAQCTNGWIVPSILIAPRLVMLPPSSTFLIILVKVLFIIINVPLVVIVFMET